MPLFLVDESTILSCAGASGEFACPEPCGTPMMIRGGPSVRPTNQAGLRRLIGFETIRSIGHPITSDIYLLPNLASVLGGGLSAKATQLSFACQQTSFLRLFYACLVLRGEQ